MALRNIRVEGDPILRKISKPVKEITPRNKELIDDLYDTMNQANGVGLAAVQVGILKRIAVVCVDSFDEEGNIVPGDVYVIINPEIEVLDEETQTGEEGCLSVPGKFGMVTRPNHIRLKAYDRNLEYYEVEAQGLLARAIQHECDHMDGVMYIDKTEGPLMELVPDDEEEPEEAGSTAASFDITPEGKISR